VTEASQSLVPACGTTFHQDYDGRDCHLTLSNNLLKLTCLASEAHSDSIEVICAIQINSYVLMINVRTRYEPLFGLV